MCIGEKRKLTIPSHLAYGSAGAGGAIPPDATLVFTTELIAIVGYEEEPEEKVEETPEVKEEVVKAEKEASELPEKETPVADTDEEEETDAPAKATPASGDDEVVESPTVEDDGNTEATGESRDEL